MHVENQSIFKINCLIQSNFWGGISACAVVKPLLCPERHSIQNIDTRKRWESALIQCVSGDCLSFYLLGCRSHNRRTHPQRTQCTDPCLVVSWCILNQWKTSQTNNLMNFDSLFHVHICEQLSFRMRIFPVPLQRPSGTKHCWTVWALIWKNVWEMLGLNVPLEIVFLFHALITDSTIKWPIFRGQNILVQVLWGRDIA